VCTLRALLAAIILTLAAPVALAQPSEVSGAGPPAFRPPPPSEPDISAAGPTPDLPEPEVRRSHPVRAVLQTTLALGLNIAWYWWDADFNTKDWDLRWDKESWKKKAVTFQAVRLDANRFSTNAGSHTEGGTLIYLIGRGNGLSVGSSTLLVLGEVVVWEYVGEFYEKPSINDMINNPLGGLAVGEAFHQLSEFFGRGSDNAVNQTLATIFSPITYVNTWADGRRPHRAVEVDRLGLPRDVYHSFALSTGVANSRWSDSTSRTESRLALNTLLNTVRGYGRAMPRAGFFGAGRLTTIDAELDLGEDGMTGALFATRVALFGHHAQDLHRDDYGDVVGNNLLLSLFNSFDYSNRRRPGLPLDQIATFGVLAPTMDASHRRGPLEGLLHLEAVPQLALVTSMAADAYRGRSGSEGLKSPLAEHGYYYAYGASLGAQLALRFHDLEAGADFRWQRFGSIEGLDRFQEQLTRDFHQVDGRSRSLVWVSVRPLGGITNLGLSLEHTNRFGTLSDVRVSQAERRASLTLSFGL
jgi:hypothetical protein